MSETVYHVTHEDNIDSIKQEGLKPSPSITQNYEEYVYVTPTRDDADDVVDAYFAGPEAVVIEAKVASHKLMDDPDPHGDLNSLAHNGHIDPEWLTVEDDQ
jgi:RNA:NAD 2'-phosphotransferase (TPT1/KptA family)